MIFSSDVSLFNFCPDDLSGGESRVLKSPNVTDLRLICVLKSSCMLCINLEVPEFRALKLRIVMSSWLTVPLIRVRSLFLLRYF